MKKRVLSFILMLVMLLSCIPLGIFASAATEEASSTKTEMNSSNEQKDDKKEENIYQKYGLGVDNTAGEYKKLNKAELATAVTAAGGTVLINTDFTGYTGSKLGGFNVGIASSNGIITVEDDNGNQYVNWGGNPTWKTDYLDLGGGFALNKDKYADPANASVIGAPYVITLTFTMTNASSFLYDRSIISECYTEINNNFSALNDEIFGFGVDRATKCLEFYYSGSLVNYSYTGGNEVTDFKVEENVPIQITLYHTPRGLNGVRDVDENGKFTDGYDDNTIHFYINGIYYGTKQALPDKYTTSWTAEINGESVYVNTASDFTYRTHWLGKRHNNFTVDDLRVYRGCEVVEKQGCAHEWEYSHTHDVVNAEAELLAYCTLCKETQTKVIPLNDCVSDALLSDEGLNNILQEDGRNALINATFSAKENNECTRLDDYAGSGLTRYNGTYKINNTDAVDWTNITLVDDGNGGYYVKWQRPIAYDPETKLPFTKEAATEKGYLSETSTFNSDTPNKCIWFDENGTPYYIGNVTGEFLEYYDGTVYAADKMRPLMLNTPDSEKIGGAYVITFDFTHYGYGLLIPFQFRSYTGANFGQVDLNLIRVDANGNLYCLNGNTVGSAVANIPAGQKVQITIWHTPRGLNGTRDITETVNSDGTVTVTQNENYDDNTYHVFINGEYKTTRQAVASSVSYKDATSGVVYNSGSDFTLQLVRVGQLNGSITSNVLAMDNFRLYRGTFEECAHSLDTEKNACEWCGEKFRDSYCEICEGKVISEGAVVTDRNVTLGEEIEMNIYLKLMDNLVKKSGAKLVIDSTEDGGSKKEEFLISELSPETEGNAKGKYKITLPLRSIDMLREVEVSVVAEDENCPCAYTTSINDYLDALDGTSDIFEERMLIKSMRNYGAYAQIYFAGINGNPDSLAEILPNAQLTEDEKNAINSVTENTLDDYSISGNGSSINVTVTKLVLSSKTMIRIYFTAPEITEVRNENGDVVTVYPSEDYDDEYYVMLTYDSPASFDTAQALTFENGYGTTTVSVSIYSCLDAIISCEDEIYAPENFKNLAKAIYLYSDAAKTYKAALSGEDTKQDWRGDDALKILFIGNSFSIDTSHWIYQIAENLGVKNIKIGNLYKSGCTVDEHIENIKTNGHNYVYYTNTDGTWSTTKGYDIETAVKSENWDFISFQQASYYTPLATGYTNVQELVELVEPMCPKAKLLWHMTWAYEDNRATTGGQGGQIAMYNNIVTQVQANIVPNDRFFTIAPVGTAIQNARTSTLGNDLTCDGAHLDEMIGRYIAGITFLTSIIDVDPNLLTWAPNGVNDTARLIAIESAVNALAKPFEVTASVYPPAETPDDGETEEPESTEGKLLITGNSYYNSAISQTPITSDSLVAKFASTQLFTKEDLPIGTVIEIASGFQYRPEGWVGTTLNTSSTRPGNVTTSKVVIDEAWWGDYTVRGFNISMTNGGLYEDNKEAFLNALTITIPGETSGLVPVEVTQ